MEPWSFIKERLKRQLSLFTAIAMMLVSVFGAMPVMAEGVPTFAVSSATANPGDTVDITINIENNPGITSAAMDVKFPDELTLTDVTLERNTYTGPFNGPQSFPVKNSARLNWANGLADTDTSGLFATLTFAVSDTAAEGTYAITVTYDPDDVFNVAEDNIDFHVSNGSITIGHKLTKVDAKDATCAEPGNSAYWICSNCGKFFADEAGKTEIEENSWVISAAHTLIKTDAKAATCTEVGNSAYWTCSTCGKYFSDEAGKNEIAKDSWVIPAGHNLTKTEAKAATCTEDGNNAYYTCSACGKIFKDAEGTQETTFKNEILAAIGHMMTKTDAKAATCTEEGNNAYYTCSACGKIFKDADGKTATTVETEKIAATGHTMTKTEAKAATCTEDGNNEYYTCSACGKAFKDADGKTVTTVEAETIAATGHTMTKTDAKAATCTEDGNIAYWYCSVCKKYFADENGTTEIALDDTVVKSHHTMTKTDAKEPTCTAEGNNAYYTCSVCGKVFQDEAGTQPTTVEAETLEKKAHTPVVDAAVAATCEKTGLTEGSHCSVCNEVLVAQKVVDKIPHTVVIDAAVEPTYSSTGLTEGKHCSVCNEVIEKQTVIPAKSETNVTVSGDEAFAGSKKELADAVLSAEDIESINNGKTVTINLKVTPKSDVTDAIKEQAKAKANDYTIGAFYDIDITKSIDGGTPIAVTSTNSLVHIQLTLADSLINTNSAVKRNYKVVRFHYDEAAGQTTADILEATYHAGYNKLSFDSDKFSVYAVVYKDTEIVTTTPTPAPTTKPDSTNVSNNNNSNTNNSNSTVEKPSVTGKVCPVCGYNNCKLGNDNRWHCGKCAHSWQEYGQTGSTSATSNAPKSPKTGLF